MVRAGLLTCRILASLLLVPLATSDLASALKAFNALSPAEQAQFRAGVNKSDATAAEAPTAFCAGLCAPACEPAASAGEVAVDGCMGRCNRRCSKHATQNQRPGALSPWITFNGAIQHVGVTTSNLTRSVLFYTKVMGGVEVEFNGGDNWDGDDVYQLLMQAALVRGGAAAGWAADLPEGGKDTMDARYVSFDAVVMEFLDYHSKEAELQRLIKTSNATTFPTSAQEVAQRLEDNYPRRSDSNIAPSVAGNMHISFQVRPELDLNKFVTELEATSQEMGYGEVYCNRVVPVPRGPNGKPDTSSVAEENNSFVVVDGNFEGWHLAYCKGPDGEQLEFNQAKGKSKENFEQALQVYFAGGENPIWV